MKFLNRTILYLVIFLSIVSCAIAVEKTYDGDLLDSHAMIFISKFKISFNNEIIKITYPKYDCLNNPYNKKNFDIKTLEYECKKQDLFLKEKVIVYPTKECIDIYKINIDNKNKKYDLLNSSNPCYGFSKNLAHIEDQDKYRILQFQNQFGLFQSVFEK